MNARGAQPERAFRSKLIYQALLLVVAGLVAFAIFRSTQGNLERLGVHSGFDFLWLRAGFEIGQKLIDYSPDSPIFVALTIAFLNTLLLALVVIALASVAGFAVGIFRLSSNWLLSRLAQIYVEIFRNVPALLQIFFWYFAVLGSLPDVQHAHRAFDAMFLSSRGLFLPAPVLGEGAWILMAFLFLAVLAGRFLRRVAERNTGGTRTAMWLRYARFAVIAVLLLLLAWPGGPFVTWEKPVLARFNYEGGLSLSPEFVALSVGLTIYHASYIAEIVRSGFQSVPGGLREAASALGLSGGQSLRLVVFPLAMRVIVPPLTTTYLNILKGTSLAAAIAYPDVMSVFVGTVNNLIGQPLEIMAATLLIYASVSLAISLLMGLCHRRQRAVGSR